MPRTRANCKRKPNPSSKSTGSNKRIKNSGKIDTHSNLELHSHIANESLPSAIISAPGPNVSGVPLVWSDHDLLSVLRSLDKSLEHLTISNVRISLYRVCYGSDQIALLNLTECPEFFQHIKPDVIKYLQPYGRGSGREVVLSTDSHFYDFTPLNAPEGDIFADVIAVTGLAGHAFGSWRNHESCKMWLQDFLPHDIKNIRIMTYGYNTNLIGKTTNLTMLDYVKHMIQELEKVRGSSEVTPTVVLPQ
ncbi:hypothetical protein K440DRAFT_679374 [Wilcoxina mikolae CBS 423.85]|nr:hypothetical protein K440DRAFT_679374 [Wilcoxina mikolae CBS 423.85]